MGRVGEGSRSVILVGFMGAGKSTVGRLLARRLDLCFVETDAMITAREGKSIPEIFAGQGEAYFRQLEAEALELLANKRGHVIATGGGFPCQAGVMDRLLELGTVVWLAVDFELAYARAERIGGRPMLVGRTREESAALYHVRQAHYCRAHLAIDTSRLSVDGVVHRILRHLRERERVSTGAGVPTSLPADAPEAAAAGPLRDPSPPGERLPGRPPSTA